MSKIKDDLEDKKNLINEELDYFYQKEQELLNNLSQLAELRQDLLNGIKDDLKKLADVYAVNSEEEDINYQLCKNCSVPCENLYCDKCQYEIEQDPNYYH